MCFFPESDVFKPFIKAIFFEGTIFAQYFKIATWYLSGVTSYDAISDSGSKKPPN